MQLVLTLPGFLAHDTGGDARAVAPCLARLIAAAGAPAREPDGIDAALAARYGVVRQSDWPLAPIRVKALGVDPGNAYWLAADPVTLVAGHDDVHLAGVVRDLTPGDAAALTDTLNAHFAGDGVAFVAPRPDAWFVRAPAKPDLATRPLATYSGTPLRAWLPTGGDAGTWCRWQNEIQMLFHEHPVNAVREREGRAPANSVWFSEGGTLPSRGANRVTIRTWTDGGVATALAAHAGDPALALPDELGLVLAKVSGREMIVVALSATQDLAVVERAWAAPAWLALKHGTLETVMLLADGAGNAVAWTARRSGAWQRFTGRFARPDLSALVAAARGER